MSDAYQQGYDAYFRGDSYSLNPYDENDAQHDDWDEGWMDAEYEADEADDEPDDKD